MNNSVNYWINLFLENQARGFYNTDILEGLRDAINEELNK